jgi:hypothetical protein
MPPTGFEPVITASERPQTHALDCAATGTSQHESRYFKNSTLSSVDRLVFVTYRWFSVRWMRIKIPALHHNWRTASLCVVDGLVGDPRMEDLTTFMCMADNGTTVARECGEFQRDEIKPLELAHSCRRYLILARESDFREFLFFQWIAMAGSINTRDKTWTEQISSLLRNTEGLRIRVDCTVRAHEKLNMVWLSQWKNSMLEVIRLTTRSSALCS